MPRTWWPGGETAPLPSDGDRVSVGMGGIRHHAMAGEDVLNVYYRLAPDVQGRGLGGRLLAACIALAPRVAPGADLVVRTRPANAVARRVAERAGFVDLGLEPGTTDMQLLRLGAPGRVVLSAAGQGGDLDDLAVAEGAGPLVGDDGA